MRNLTDTSIEAYKDLDKTKTERLRRRILACLTITPMTDEEIIEALGGEQYNSPSGVRTRRSELAKRGFVYDSGVRRKTKTGKNSIVWTIQPQARLFE